jgi:ribonuclease-3
VQLLSKIWAKSSEEKALRLSLKSILGYSVKDIALFKTAFTHRSVNTKNKFGKPINFERLEFLGDSVIDTVVASHLYGELLHDNEGELTRMKSKIVSRDKLNIIGKKLGLFEHLICAGKKSNFGDDIHGNLLESLIGAVFIEKGYEYSKKIVFNIIIHPHIDLETVKKEIISYKSLLIEWGQKEKKWVEFITKKEDSNDNLINFQCELHLENKKLLKVREASKKKAEEKAARRAVKILKIR